MNPFSRSVGLLSLIFSAPLWVSAHSEGHGPRPKLAAPRGGVVSYLYSVDQVKAATKEKPLTESVSRGVVELVTTDGTQFELSSVGESPLSKIKGSDLKIIALSKTGDPLAVMSIERTEGSPWRFGLKTPAPIASIEVIVTDRAAAGLRWLASFPL